MIALFSGQGLPDPKILERHTAFHQEFYSYLEARLVSAITSENFSQPRFNSAVVVADGLASFLDWQSKTGERPVCFAGHSVGHLTALAAAGALGWREVLDLTLERSQLMAPIAKAGTMLSLLGPSIETVREHLRTSSVSIAAFNSPIQHTLSGSREDLETVLASLPSEQVLQVQWFPHLGPWHGPLLQAVAPRYRDLLGRTQFSPWTGTVLSNVTGETITFEDLRSDLCAHLTSPVQWYSLVSKLGGTALEFGSQGTLTKLLFYANRGVSCRVIRGER